MFCLLVTESHSSPVLPDLHAEPGARLELQLMAPYESPHGKEVVYCLGEDGKSWFRVAVAGDEAPAGGGAVGVGQVVKGSDPALGLLAEI